MGCGCAQGEGQTRGCLDKKAGQGPYELGKNGTTLHIHFNAFSEKERTIVVRAIKGSPEETALTPPRSNTIDRVDGNVRTIVLMDSETARFDFTTMIPNELIDGQAFGCRFGDPFNCYEKWYNETCVDAGAFDNRAGRYFNCGIVEIWHGPPSCDRPRKGK